MVVLFQNLQQACPRNAAGCNDVRRHCFLFGRRRSPAVGLMYWRGHRRCRLPCFCPTDAMATPWTRCSYGIPLAIGIKESSTVRTFTTHRTNTRSRLPPRGARAYPICIPKLSTHRTGTVNEFTWRAFGVCLDHCIWLTSGPSLPTASCQCINVSPHVSPHLTDQCQTRTHPLRHGLYDRHEVGSADAYTRDGM